MANQLQEAVFTAIDTLVSQRIDKLQLDKTVTATIVSCTNALTGEYKVSYNGGFMTAYANEGTTYNKNTEVYVLVPESDFTKQKYIVSKAQAISNDNNISFVSSALSNYNLIGRNIINNKNMPQGVNSYLTKDMLLIYDRENTSESLITINDNEFYNNLKEAEALMIEASFHTRLPKVHQLVPQGNYGVKFTLAFKDASNSNVEKATSSEEIKNIVISDMKNSNDFKKASQEIEELQKQLENIWSSPNLTLEDKKNLTVEAQNKIRDWSQNNNNVIKDLSSKDKDFISDFLDQKSQDTSSNTEVKDINKIKYYDYIIDSNNMTGNPFLFNSWSDQYNIYPIDVANFLYIQRIVFYCENFVTENDLNTATTYGDDIFIKDLEIYGLKTISAKSGDYSLTLSMPLGSTFKSIRSDDYLEIAGTLKNKNSNISDSAMFYWFIEDNRITSTSEYYQYYGGAGWKYLKDKKNTPNLVMSSAENRAYENKYLCVCVYQDTVILKEKFTLYNEAAKADLEIISTLGTKFTFDQGTPKLTCLINGRSENFDKGEINPRDDDQYTFVWSKTDEFGYTTIFNQTIKDIDAEIESVTTSDVTNKASLLLDLRTRKQALQGVNFEVGKNWIEYPTKQIMTNGSATFKCSVYAQDKDTQEPYPIGTAEITLMNSGAASPTDYYILIENGDQVFQYSESGVSPDDERYQDPLEILPLTCHFYYPTGEEVESAQYDIKWKVPLTNTLIKVPKEGMILNPATGKIEWSTSQIYPTMIKGDYDYQALNNQITCIVTFDNQEYTKDTTFLFTKIGENGTNGTDMVGKIVPTSNSSILEKEVLTLILKYSKGVLNKETSKWNTGQSINSKILDFNLYQRNQLITDDKMTIKWSMAGGNNSSHLIIPGKDKTQCILDWYVPEEKDKNVNYPFNQIVRGQVRYQQKDYYAFYPIATVKQYNANATISIDAKKTLKYITYSAAGENPLYNKNQGISIKFNYKNSKPTDQYTISFEAIGGESNNTITSNFSLISEKDQSIKDAAKTLNIDSVKDNDTIEIYILPNDTYSGAYSNNIVHGKVYTAGNNSNPLLEFYIPIHMSLNTYGLASLNAWDGNHIEINEDENYIIAPQIGAGEKDEANRFTGVVMGTAQTYADKEHEDAKIGLLGYSHGEQSIFLDAVTGNAIFGLTENSSDGNNRYTEGRIELRPGKESTIGSWTIGSRSLYNVKDRNLVTPDKTYTYAPTVGKETTPLILPHDKRGILLNADPAFISLKTDPIVLDSSQLNDLNRKIENGDTLELELDPNKLSVFSIYRHVASPIIGPDGKITSYSYSKRERMVGINSKGRFEVNALKDGDSSMGISEVGAFESISNDKKYIGVNFEYNEETFLKMFRPIAKDSNDDIPLYVSGSSTKNEYMRPLSMHFKNIDIYATNSTTEAETIKKVVDNKITLSGSSTGNLFAGRTSASYLNLSFNPAGNSSLVSNNTLGISATKNISITSTNKNNIVLSGAATLTLDSAGVSTLTNKSTIINISNTGADRFKIITPNSNFLIENKSIALSYTSGNSSKFILNQDAKSELHLDKGIDITSGGSGKGSSGILIQDTGVNGFTIKAIPPNGSSGQGVKINATPQDGGSATRFSIATPQGNFETVQDTTYGISGFGFSQPVWFKQGAILERGNGLTYNGASIGLSVLSKDGTYNPGGHIYCEGNVFASDLKWFDLLKSGTIRTSVPGVNNWGTYDSYSPWYHILHIYEILDYELDAIRTWRNSVNDSISKINSNFNTHTHKFGYYEPTDNDKVYYNRYPLNTLWTTGIVEGSITVGEHQHKIDNTGNYVDFDGNSSHGSPVLKSLTWKNNAWNTSTPVWGD